MKPRASDMQDALAKAQHELELSTFLNKGILQSNAEYKLRIAELEKQNILLRAAEKRLSSTEDALETCEQRLKTAEMERNAAVREARRIAERVAGLEQERDGWKARFEAVREYWKSLLRGMDDVLDVQPPQHASGSSVRSDPAVSRSARKSRSSMPTAGPSVPPSRRAKTHEIGKDKSAVSGDPDDSSPAARLGSLRKRRRPLSTTPEVEAEASPSVSPPRRRSEPRKARNSYGTARHRPLSPVHNRHMSDDIAVQPKAEPFSPASDPSKAKGADVYDSDDDPLAMS
ncbi:hypothetical protein DB88DRAFT_497334 [Papiliotrema laurentii]|uniref:Uncharacterized protein n=1 Tax=Papiliotrema laurentii TaxID=5418 RepID=A0AAD9CU93_PAPLA|nr:hypothetical protein DB88DRAFT_497334 [Papiliotrema laurentii]